MTKVKTSISLEERLVADLDRQAKADGISRSEMIERLCRRSLNREQRVEVMRFMGPPTAVITVLSSLGWTDDHGPVELSMTVTPTQWEERWRRNRAAYPADGTLPGGD